MSLSHFHIWLRVGSTSLRLFAVCIGLPFVLKRCLRVYRAEFATTQLLDLTVWVGLSAARTRMAQDSSQSDALPNSLFDLRLDKITRRI